MILYVDETENDNYFIVVGLLMSSDKEANNLFFYSFKKHTRNYKLKKNVKKKLYNEFKSFYLDKNYQKIKKNMLNIIFKNHSSSYYSYYIKKDKHISYILKKNMYIKLLDCIVKDIDSCIDIVFDEFGDINFEESIIDKISRNSNVKSIKAVDSRKSAGLILVDNLCSTVRLHLSNADTYNFYDIISKYCKELKIYD